MDCSLQDSSVHGIFQARLPFPTPGDLPDWGIDAAMAGGFFITESPGKPLYLHLKKHLKILANLFISLIQTTSFSHLCYCKQLSKWILLDVSGFYYSRLSPQTWPNLSVGIRIILFSMKVKAYYSSAQILGLDHLLTQSGSYTIVCGECVWVSVWVSVWVCVCVCARVRSAMLHPYLFTSLTPGPTNLSLKPSQLPHYSSNKTLSQIRASLLILPSAWNGVLRYPHDILLSYFRSFSSVPSQ